MSKPKKKIRGHKNSCGDKRKFDTWDEADKASRINRWDFMQAYKCKKCKKFHYGHIKQQY